MSDNPIVSKPNGTSQPAANEDPIFVPKIETKSRPPNRLFRSVLFNFVIPIAMIAGAVLLVLWLGKAAPSPRDSDDVSRAGRMKALTPVRVAELRSLQATGEQLQLEVDGTVVPFREARVASEVAGRVVFKHDRCEAGSVVKTGDVLMRIDPTDYKLAVDRLTRQKEQAYQSLIEVDQEMVNANRLIKVAEQDVALQKAELKRQESLPKGFSSRKDIDTAKRGLLQAQQTLVNNINNLDLLKKRRVRLEASEAVAATELMAANMNLTRTEIKAPIDGVIVREDADLNTFVNRGTVLVTIEDTSKVEVATNLRMDQLYWVMDQVDRDTDSLASQYHLPETPAIIEYQLAGRGDQAYQWNGRLLSYDGIGLDPQTRTVPVRVLVDNPQTILPSGSGTRSSSGPSALIRGMYVSVKLLITPKTPLVVIPGTALQPGNRVLQFVQDESVLNPPEKAESPQKDKVMDKPTPIVETAAKEPDSYSQDSPDKAAEPAFDPKPWSAGRIVIQSEVIPVDTLTISGDAFKADEDQPISDLSTRARFWVCETNGQDFGANSFVVTSPVGSIDAKGMPARAKTKPAQDVDASTPKEPSESPPDGDASGDPDVPRQADQRGAA